LGFAGSPWTVATYMIAGQGSREQAEARRLAHADPGLMQALVDRIVDCTIDYLKAQIDAGVEAVQLFDSWAGSLSPEQFERWVIAPTARIAAAVKGRAPVIDRKSTRLNSSHVEISYAVFCLKKKRVRGPARQGRP